MKKLDEWTDHLVAVSPDAYNKIVDADGDVNMAVVTCGLARAATRLALAFCPPDQRPDAMELMLTYMRQEVLAQKESPQQHEAAVADLDLPH